MLQRIMNKVAGIRDQQEKQPFLNGEFEKSYANQIIIIKTPDLRIGEVDIPDYKKNPRHGNCREIRLPEENEMHPPLLETEAERYGETAELQKKVIEFFQLLARIFLHLARLCKIFPRHIEHSETLAVILPQMFVVHLMPFSEPAKIPVVRFVKPLKTPVDQHIVD